MATIHAFEFLQQSLNELPSLVALVGDDDAIRRIARTRLISAFDADVSELAGESAEWRDLRDIVSTGSLFSTAGMRIVTVSEGDAFLKKHRAELEAYAQQPADTACLILQLQALPANTRLHKAIAADHLLIQCNVPATRQGRAARPDTGKLATFLCESIAPRYQCKLQKSAALALIELLGNHVGMLETEIAKLAVSLPVGKTIDEALVRDAVGGWRTKTTWEIIDAAAAGDAGQALQHLDRLLASGESPNAVLPQLAWSLRRLGMATAAVEYAERRKQRISLSDALGRAGVRGFQVKKAESQLRQLGRTRGKKMLAWLRDADLKLKGSHSTADRGRWVLEELFLKLARQNESPAP